VLVAVGDVEQLQDVRRVIPLAAEGALDLERDRRQVVGELEQLDAVAGGRETLAELARLRLLAALVEALERDQGPRTGDRTSDSAFTTRTPAGRRGLAAPDDSHRPPSTSTSAGVRRRL